jgi:hypothetical protein
MQGHNPADFSSSRSAAIRFCSVRRLIPKHLGCLFAIAAHVIEGQFDVSLLEFHEGLARLEQDGSTHSRLAAWSTGRG